MKKKQFLILILLLVIGFASVTTSIVINGNLNIGFNDTKFEEDIIFTRAKTNTGTAEIGSTKKTISFNTDKLENVNQTSVLEFDVTNKNRNYDADVTIKCGLENEFESYSEYVSFSMNLESPFELIAGNKKTGHLTVEMTKGYGESLETEISYVCELVAAPKEREELGEPVCKYEEGQEWLFDYTGSEQEFVVPCDGDYELEVWGAAGGSETSTYHGGYGGYSNGLINMSKNSIFYINVGGAGGSYVYSGTALGGYNGGGSAYGQIYNGEKSYVTGGGGATHIALTSGTLSSLSSNIEHVLMVAGGGGGSSWWADSSDTWTGVGGSGGGFIGGTASSATSYAGGRGGTQSSGFSFGKGGGNVYNASGGGGGLYGGLIGVWSASGGGSGYIGNPVLTNKSMYCYNCTESDEESTKTISTTCVSTTPTPNCAKKGNGYAKITYIRN